MITLGASATLRRNLKTIKIVKILILDHRGEVPDRLPENSQRIPNRRFRGSSEDTQDTPREAHSLSTKCQKVLQDFLHNLLGAVGDHDHILSEYCLNIVLEYFLNIF